LLGVLGTTSSVSRAEEVAALLAALALLAVV